MLQDENWIDSLKAQIIESDDKILFEESASCFLSGYLRASYILAWISIVESLKRKIILLSNLGDIKSKDASKRIEEAEDKKQSVDKMIFEEAKNCGIIDTSEYSKVNYLWEQRCLFAHPYNLKPEPDEVKHILGQAIRITLSKQLYYNKDFLTELAENIANKPFFLPTDIEQVSNHARRTVARITEGLHPFFFKTLLFKVGEICLQDEKFSELNKLRCYLVELLINTSLPLEHDNWTLENRVTKFPYECFIGFVHEETWNKIPARVKEMLIGYFESEHDALKLSMLKQVIGRLAELNALEESYQNRFHAKLDKLSFDSAIHFYGSIDAKYNRLWRDLSSYQFDKQNPVIDFLRNDKSTNFINSLEIESQFNLGRLLKSSAQNNHWKSQSHISNIYNGHYGIPAYLKSGIAYGSFISMNKKVSIDNKDLTQAVELLNSFPEEVQNYVYDLIESILEQTKPDEWDNFMFNETKFDELSNKIRTSISNWNENNKSKFERISEKIKQYFVQK